MFKLVRKKMLELVTKNTEKRNATASEREMPELTRQKTEKEMLGLVKRKCLSQQKAIRKDEEKI